MKSSLQVRKLFFEFFKDHCVQMPAKLVSSTNTNFTIAGMQQFTDIFFRLY